MYVMYTYLNVARSFNIVSEKQQLYP